LRSFSFLNRRKRSTIWDKETVWKSITFRFKILINLKKVGCLTWYSNYNDLVITNAWILYIFLKILIERLYFLFKYWIILILDIIVSPTAKSQ
jgi:hypothetical protein